MSDWTIDTSVLHQCAIMDFGAIHLMSYIVQKRHKICVDQKGYILDEYYKCMTKTEMEDGSRLLKKIYKALFDRGFNTLNGCIPKTHIKKLTSLGVNNEDHPFIGVASKSHNKRLVSMDGDFGQKEVKEYVHDKFGVLVFNICEAEKSVST